MTTLQFQRGAIDATGSISNGYNLIKPNYGIYLGFCAIIAAVIYCVPCINIFIMGPLTGGIYFVALRDMRGEPVDFSMFFKGFEKFPTLLVIGIVQAVPAIISQIFQFTFRISDVFLRGINGGFDPDRMQGGDPNIWIAGGFLTALLVFSVVMLVVSIAWAITFSFAVPLAIENDLGAIDALKMSARAGWSNVGGIIVLSILTGLMIFAGFLVICIGALFVLPIVYAAWAFAYRQVFPAIDPPVYQNVPPPPGHYGTFGQGM